MTTPRKCITCKAETKEPIARGWCCTDTGWECPKCTDNRNAIDTNGNDGHGYSQGAIDQRERNR